MHIYAIGDYLNIFIYVILIKNNVMSKKDMTLTSVKIQSDLFDEFKVSCVRHKFSFQKLADRAIHLYLTDDNFRKIIHNHNILETK